MLCGFALLSMIAGKAGTASTTRPQQTVERTYSDPAGDARGGVGDITTIRVGNDGDWIRFAISVDARGTTRGELWIDVTEIRGTRVDLLKQPSLNVGFPREPLKRFDEANSTWRRVPGAKVVGAYANGVWSVAVRRGDLGNATRIQFNVHFYVDTPGKITQPTDKTKPEGYALIDYTMTIVGPNTIPATGPIAGRQFSAAFTIRLLRSDGSPERIGSGDVTCTATAGGKRLHVDFEDFYRGTGASGATCAWAIPPSARGSIFKGTVVVRARGRPVTATKTISYRVR